MDLNNDSKLTSYNIDYLLSFQKLREQILAGEATWQDVVDLRYKYNMPELSKDTIRKGVLFYDEFNNAGCIHTESQKYYSNMDEENTCHGGGGGNIYKYATDKVITEYKNGEYTSDRVVELSDTEVNDKDSLLKAHGFNPSEWILISARTSKWQQGDGVGGVKNLYSSRISVKPRNIPLSSDWYEEMLNEISVVHKKENPIYSNYSKTGEMLVVALDDLHWGRMAWEEETGVEYNLEIARKRILDNISMMIAKFKDRKFEEIVLKMGSDLLNSNSEGVTSAHKNPQDNAGVYKKIFTSAIDVMTKVIEMFSTLAPVKVEYVAGNHAISEDFFLGKVLEAYFRNDDSVKVDANASLRKYIVFGTNLIGFTHGDKEKKDEFGNLMAYECPDYWARTTERCWIVGHLHHIKERTFESNGVVVFTVPSLVADDNWTKGKGLYSKKRTMCFIFDREMGLVETHYFNIRTK